MAHTSTNEDTLQSLTRMKPAALALLQKKVGVILLKLSLLLFC